MYPILTSILDRLDTIEKKLDVLLKEQESTTPKAHNVPHDLWESYLLYLW